MKKLTATKVAQHLDISMMTLNNWYRWYLDPDTEKPKDMPKLPMYEQSKERAPRYWKESDLPKLKKFQEWIPKGRGGLMGSTNAVYWGERGRRALKNKKLQKD